MILTGPFRQILTMDGIPLKGALQPEQMPVIEHGWIAMKHGTISGMGSYRSMRDRFPEASIISLDGDYVALPAFIDSHTHLCWAGTRAADFTMRANGQSYLDIAAAGGGIQSSVNHTRAAKDGELLRLMRERVESCISQGITTIEVKSGYGLSVHEELRMLRVIRQLKRESNATIVPTCLAAHLVPKDHPGEAADYLAHLAEELLPQIRAEHLANRLDIFIEPSTFSAEQGRSYLEHGKQLGFDFTIHGDQFHTGGSALAILVGAVSVDHLEASGDREIAALAKSDVIATVLPGASLGLGMPFAPARKLLDSGCALSIASDWNPGSAPMGQLLTQAALLGTYEKLNAAEVFAGLTARAAAALKLTDRGVLRKGMQADIQAFPTDDYREILYHQGNMQPEKVWIKGYLH